MNKVGVGLKKFFGNLDKYVSACHDEFEEIRPRWWGRIGAESALVVFGIFVSICHLNASGVLHVQGVDWNSLLARFFTPAWAVTAATAGYLVGFAVAIVAHVVSFAFGLVAGCAVSLWQLVQVGKS